MKAEALFGIALASVLVSERLRRHTTLKYDLEMLKQDCFC